MKVVGQRLCTSELLKLLLRASSQTCIASTCPSRITPQCCCEAGARFWKMKPANVASRITGATATIKPHRRGVRYSKSSRSIVFFCLMEMGTGFPIYVTCQSGASHSQHQSKLQQHLPLAHTTSNVLKLTTKRQHHVDEHHHQ